MVVAHGHSTGSQSVPRVPFTDLTASVLRKHCPDLILTPLISKDFDAVDLAARLKRLGYGGRLRVLSAPLPNVPMVEHEIARRSRGVDTAIVVVGQHVLQADCVE